MCVDGRTRCCRPRSRRRNDLEWPRSTTGHAVGGTDPGDHLAQLLGWGPGRDAGDAVVIVHLLDHGVSEPCAIGHRRCRGEGPRRTRPTGWRATAPSRRSHGWISGVTITTASPASRRAPGEPGRGGGHRAQPHRPVVDLVVVRRRERGRQRRTGLLMCACWSQRPRAPQVATPYLATRARSASTSSPAPATWKSQSSRWSGTAMSSTCWLPLRTPLSSSGSTARMDCRRGPGAAPSSRHAVRYGGRVGQDVRIEAMTADDWPAVRAIYEQGIAPASPRSRRRRRRGRRGTRAIGRSIGWSRAMRPGASSAGWRCRRTRRAASMRASSRRASTSPRRPGDVAWAGRCSSGSSRTPMPADLDGAGGSRPRTWRASCCTSARASGGSGCGSGRARRDGVWRDVVLMERRSDRVGRSSAPWRAPSSARSGVSAISRLGAVHGRDQVLVDTLRWRASRTNRLALAVSWNVKPRPSGKIALAPLSAAASLTPVRRGARKISARHPQR